MYTLTYTYIVLLFPSLVGLPIQTNMPLIYLHVAGQPHFKSKKCVMSNLTLYNEKWRHVAQAVDVPIAAR